MLHRKFLSTVGTDPQAKAEVTGDPKAHNGRSRKKKADNTCQNAVFYICDHRNKYNQKDNPHRKEKKQVFCICFTGIPVSGICLLYTSCAMGYSGAQFDPEKVDLYFESRAGKIKIIENGVSTGYSEDEATKILSEDAVTAIADIKMGDCTATAWGCDLTYDYVKINADYRS